MGSQTNHNATYIYTVDGHTVWERLRVIREFISSIQSNYDLALIDLEESDLVFKNLTNSRIDKVTKRRMIIHRVDGVAVIERAKDELDFLYDFEKKLVTKAEETRVEGKTDVEMYELNFYDELIAQLIHSASAEILSTGVMSIQTVKDVLKHPEAMARLNEIGIIQSEAFHKLLSSSQIKGISYA